MYKYTCIALLLFTAGAQAQGDIDQVVLQQIFGNPNQNGDSSTTPTNPNDPSLIGIFGTPPPVPDRGQTSTPVSLQPVTDAPGDVKSEVCQTYENTEGKCVPYYLCNTVNNTIISDGSGIIDIRIKDGPCESYLDTCCLLPDTRPVDNPITPSPTPNNEQHKGCGWRNPNGVGFRITGNKDGEAEFAEFPWMVAILKLEPVNENEPNGQRLNVYVGGGSLIHPSVVLTAAHYIARDWPQKSIRARAGEWDTQTKQEIYPYQDRDVTDVTIHQDFNKGNLFYDIAILFLSSPLELAPNVGVACLPPPRERVPGGTRCYASGWGKDHFEKEGRYQVILKKVEVPVVDRSKCQNQLRKTRLGAVFQLHTSFMCAGGEPDKDTCKGDGGSPLVCPIENEVDRFMQSGIVAWGIGCGQDGVPGVYVDVSFLRPWIDNAVAGKGFDITTYAI